MTSSERGRDGLLEYSVVYTGRALNHMSSEFRQVMQDLSAQLKEVYDASAVAIVPGSGTFAMEAVARQLATGLNCLVIRTGWFSYRWNQILDVGSIPMNTEVLKARPTRAGHKASMMPPPIEEVIERIESQRPAVVFAPHVETSAGMMLSDDYLRAIAEAAHDVGGLLVVDSIASGAIWLSMKRIGIDVVISAPQKGWASSPCCGLVMLSDLARARVSETTSTSFSMDLNKWLEVMLAYEGGGHAYHTTMPTDGLRRLRDTMGEARNIGFARLEDAQVELGQRVRMLLEQRGYPSVAAPGYQSPAVVVCYTDDIGVHSGAKFAAAGIQIAAGVPLRCDEPVDFRTFRIGLFGIDKLLDIDGTVAGLERALDSIEG